jgi:hypothetical protein
MRAGFIRREIRRTGYHQLIQGVLVMLVLNPWVLGSLVPGVLGGRGDSWFPQILFGGISVAGLAIAARGASQLYHQDEHPDWRALGRYGPPWQIASEVDAE